MKNIMFLVATGLTAMAIAPQAFAVPGYARQTGLACTACHFQSFPALNEFGRTFKAGGYTMMGAQQKIEGSEGLSLPDTLNAGAVMKIRHQKSNGVQVPGTHTTNDGELQFFDEMLLMLGGRVSEHIGVQLELNLLSKDAEPVVENFKMPFVYDVGGIQAGIIPFTTSGQGVAYGFELLNTGAVRGARIMEARKSFSAQQYIGTGSAAEGVAVVASSPKFFANVSKWSPRSIGAAESGSPTANYFRLAYTPKFGNWDAGIGLQSWRGSATDPSLTPIDTKASAVDAQLQGEVGAMPVGIYLTHAKADATGATGNFFNSEVQEKTATTVAGQLGVLPGRVTLLMAYRNADNGKASANGDNSLMLGATYMLVQNVQLQFNHERFSGSAYDATPANGNKLTTLMLFAAF